MIYKFIADEDIYVQIKNDMLADIISDSTERQKKIQRAEASVLRQIKSKAGKWYEMEQILVSTPQWLISKPYLSGEHVYDNGVFYIALADNTGLKPAENINAWKENDPRHELLVMYAVDMILYHLHSSVNPRKIPDLRKTRYEEAKAWLEMIADRQESPDFPEMETDEQLVIWGSNPQVENYS